MATDPIDPRRPLPPHRLLRHGWRAAIAAAVLVTAGCAGAATPSVPGAASGSGVTLGVAHSPSNIARALPGTSPTPVPAGAVNCVGPGNSPNCGVTKNPKFAASKTPTGGLSPAQLRTIYGLPNVAASASTGTSTIAIVDAFNDTTAESDLAAYRSQYGLPACSTKSGCLKIVLAPSLTGLIGAILSPPPSTNDTTTWADETALDLAMASASCPTCKLLLVETTAEDLDSLSNGVNVAASYNPQAISASWGVVEAGNIAGIDVTAQADFDHPGIPITAAAGDLGQVQFPASSPFVTSVGGTTLTPDAASPRGYDESVWQNSASGCSVMFALPLWDTNSNCGSFRGPADISFVGDPLNPGIAVYSTTQGGWVVLGGTSAGAPFVAGLYAQANNFGSLATGAPTLYAKTASFNAVSGANGTTLGSPNGLSGF